MARARNIKPGFFKNELLVELPYFDRLLFVGLWTLADREGRVEDRPKKIKLELFPCDSDDVSAALDHLCLAHFIERYEAGGVKVIEIANFLKHQNPHGTEKDSELPDQEGNLTVHERGANGYVTGTRRKGNVKTDENNVNPLLEPVNPPTHNALIPDSLIPESFQLPEANASVSGKPETGLAETSLPNPSLPNCPADDIIALYHELMPLNPRVKVLGDARRKTIRARWKEAALLKCEPFGYSNRDDGMKAWRQYFEICAESEFLTGRATALPGKPPFVADIDFLMSPSGFTKCLENKYHREVA